ncbi:helix-turn-helix domain-containing protein [Nocardia abscessus]|nr:helix-turn-helix domain-containing protein [Nocardia abscessus]
MEQPARLHSVDNTRNLLGGISRTLCYQLMASGELRFIKVGTRRMVPESAIADFIARQLAKGSDVA